MSRGSNLMQMYGTFEGLECYPRSMTKLLGRGGRWDSFNIYTLVN